MKTFKKFVDSIDRVTKWAAIIAFAVMSVMIVLQIIFRYILGAALSFSEELARYLFIWSALLGSAMCLKRRSHVSVELLMTVMPKAVKKYCVLLANVIGMIFYVILIVYGFEVVGVTMGQKSPGLGLQMGYVYLSIPISGIIMLIDAVYNTIQDFTSFNKSLSIQSTKEVNEA
jgi:TRAP-type C4-dicarboxylate transport system permease small subunit